MRIVPQGEEWCRALGKCHSTLHPGLNIIIPYLDAIAQPVGDQGHHPDVQEQEVITRDNAVILTNAIAFIKVTDPIKAGYGVVDFSEAIRNPIMTTLRSIVGEMQLDEALSNRDRIRRRLREHFRRAIDRGLTVKSVEVRDIKPSPSMQKAMEMQASAERERKAMVTKAEGAKRHDPPGRGRLEAAHRDATAQVTLAEASRSHQARHAAIGTEEAPMRYMLGEKYLAAWEPAGGVPENAKTALPPYLDIQETIRGCSGRKADRKVSRGGTPPACPLPRRPHQAAFSRSQSFFALPACRISCCQADRQFDAALWRNAIERHQRSRPARPCRSAC